MRSVILRRLLGPLLALGLVGFGLARLAAAQPGHSVAVPSATAAPALPLSNAPTPAIPLNPGAGRATPVPRYTPVFPARAPHAFATPTAPPADIPLNPHPLPATPIPVYTPDPPRGIPHAATPGPDAAP
ncbi:MAG TPA: hypothetical protein VKV26_15460 [Dehalococcoidia bacterium]|nr:hypothetical protein [Dehalococcoidia bacterium]